METRGRAQSAPRRLACLTVFAATLAAPGLAHAGYGARLSEVLSDGRPGAHADLTLTATLSDGGGGGRPSQPTGRLAFAIDRGHLDPAALSELALATPAGTRIGTATTDLTDSTSVARLLPLTTVSTTLDPLTSTPIVHARIALPASAGPPGGLPVEISVLSVTQLGVSVDLRGLATGSPTRILGRLTLTLSGSSGGSGGAVSHIVTNPGAPLRLTNTLSAEPCAAAACASLGPALTDAAAITLPKAVSIAAPRRATYGRLTSFGVRGAPGDALTLLVQAARLGFVSAPSPGPGSAAFPRSVREGKTIVRASTTYAVEATEGENASVRAVASRRTAVALTSVSLRMRRVGGRLRVRAHVPGGDELVRVAIRLGPRTVAAGQLGQGAAFVCTLPVRPGRYQAIATVPGATSSRSAVLLVRA